MNPSQSAKKLHTINHLFAMIAGSNRSIADQVSSAINFSLKEESADVIDEYALDRFGEQLVNFYKNAADESLAFAHCDFRGHDFDPLWLREKLIENVVKVLDAPKGIVLVTGIRQLICPVGKKWTKKRQIKYQEIIQYMDDTAAANSSPFTQLHLLFV